MSGKAQETPVKYPVSGFLSALSHGGGVVNCPLMTTNIFGVCTAMLACCRSRRMPPIDDTEVKHPSHEYGSETHSVILYAVRHGEALHNICEREASESVERAMTNREGACDATVMRDAKDAARKAALLEPSLHDAPLSDAGKDGALVARTTLGGLFDSGFPTPTLVLSSPLQRALQTAALIFPEHGDVRVREELRERRTGLPCDERSSVVTMSKRRSFSRMRFSMVPPSPMRLPRPSLTFGRTASGRSLRGDISREDSSSSPRSTSGRTGTSSVSIINVTEEKGDVRVRAGGLLDLLRHPYREHSSVAFVTHKGWLREFERGCLRREGAAEFGNCEVRAWELVWTDGELHVTRKHPVELPTPQLDAVDETQVRFKVGS